jgi:hypothetical protein
MVLHMPPSTRSGCCSSLHNTRCSCCAHDYGTPADQRSRRQYSTDRSGSGTARDDSATPRFGYTKEERGGCLATYISGAALVTVTESCMHNAPEVDP